MLGALELTLKNLESNKNINKNMTLMVRQKDLLINLDCH